LADPPRRAPTHVRTLGAELESYGLCVDRNPGTWSSACADVKAALNACAAKNVGLVDAVKRRCRSQIEQYELCLTANAAHPETCAPQLQRLWDCTERPALPG
jgi:hypothetical protein